MYIFTIEPTNELSRIVNYIRNHYVPIWFRIKSNPLSTDGPKNMFYSASLMRELPAID